MDLSPAVCPFCSCHCDDLRLTLDGGHLDLAGPECEWARRGYRLHQAHQKPVNKEIKKAGKHIAHSKSMLIIISGEAGSEAVEPSAALASEKNAYVSTETPLDWSLALGREGWLTASLGDLKKSNGPLVFCGIHPEDLPPRFWEQIGTSRQRDARWLPADIDPMLMMRWFRLMFKKELDAIPVDFRKKFQLTISKQTGTIILGDAWLQHGEQVLNETLRWLNALNTRGHWYGTRCSSAPNNYGIAEALKRITGYPGGIRFFQNQISFLPREDSIIKLLQRQEVDLILFIGNPQRLSQVEATLMKGGKTVVISSSKPEWKPACWIQAAQPGIDTSGSMLRFDGLTMQLEKWVDSSRPSTPEVLESLMDEVRR